MKKIMYLVTALMSVSAAVAQTAVQPKIMVIPYTKEGEDIRTILEKDENKRIVLTKIKEGFDGRGVSTIDFVAKLKSIESSNVFNENNKEDIKSQIIDMSGADIYVEAEIVCNQDRMRTNGGKPESSVKIVITAYESATGASLSNKVGDSGNFYTDDIARLATKAISSCVDDFLQTMQSKLTDIAENGRSLMVQIGFDENSNYTMESEVGTQGYLLQDEIELWVANKAYNGNYHMQGVSSAKMIFDDVRIPLIDEATGKTYSASRFSLECMQFFRSLNIQVSRSIRGNTLYVTIK